MCQAFFFLYIKVNFFLFFILLYLLISMVDPNFSIYYITYPLNTKFCFLFHHMPLTPFSFLSSYFFFSNLPRILVLFFYCPLPILYALCFFELFSFFTTKKLKFVCLWCIESYFDITGNYQNLFYLTIIIFLNKQVLFLLSNNLYKIIKNHFSIQ